MHAPDERFAVRGEEVAAKSFDGEVVVVHLGTCTYYSAAGSGADVWTWLEEGRGVAEVADLLAGRYAIDPVRSREDVDRFVAELLAEGLIAPANGAAPASGSPAFRPAGEYSLPELHAYRDMADLLALDPPLPELDRPAWRAAGDDGRD